MITGSHLTTKYNGIKMAYGKLALADEQIQDLLKLIQAADYDGLAGWLIWTAFDFPLAATCISPPCPSLDAPEYHFGLWRSDYTPKIAAGVVQILAAQP